jgi:hypothetical protein
MFFGVDTLRADSPESIRGCRSGDAARGGAGCGYTFLAMQQRQVIHASPELRRRRGTSQKLTDHTTYICVTLRNFVRILSEAKDDRAA